MKLEHVTTHLPKAVLLSTLKPGDLFSTIINSDGSFSEICILLKNYPTNNCAHPGLCIARIWSLDPTGYIGVLDENYAYDITAVYSIDNVYLTVKNNQWTTK